VSKPPFATGSLQPTQTERRLIKIIDTLGLKSLLKPKVDELAEKIFDFIPHTPISNMTGQPSASVPLYWTDGDLPVGSMFTAAFGREDLLFQLSGQLEKAQPWFNNVPSI
jgi:amidase